MKWEPSREQFDTAYEAMTAALGGDDLDGDDDAGYRQFLQAALLAALSAAGQSIKNEGKREERERIKGLASSGFVPISEVAAVIDRTEVRVYQLMAAGELPSVRVAGRIRIPRPAFDAWLADVNERALASVRKPVADVPPPRRRLLGWLS